MKNLYNENNKTLMKDSEEDTNGKIFPFSWIRRINSVKMSIRPKAAWRRNYSMMWPLPDLCKPCQLDSGRTRDCFPESPSEIVWSTPPLRPTARGVLVPGTGCCPSLGKQERHLPLLWGRPCPSTSIHPTLSCVTPSHPPWSTEEEIRAILLLPETHPISSLNTLLT